MNTEHEARRAEPTQVLPYIQRLTEWARDANAYVDGHNAPLPDGTDDFAREELIAAMDGLSDLLQRYADSLRGFEEHAPSSACNPASDDDSGATGFGALLRFPARSRPALILSHGGADHRARPFA